MATTSEGTPALSWTQLRAAMATFAHDLHVWLKFGDGFYPAGELTTWSGRWYLRQSRSAQTLTLAAVRDGMAKIAPKRLTDDARAMTEQWLVVAIKRGSDHPERPAHVAANDIVLELVKPGPRVQSRLFDLEANAERFGMGPPKTSQD